MCRGTYEQQWQPKQQWGQDQQNQWGQRPQATGGNRARTPTSALEHCLRSRGVDQAWDLLEVLLQADGGASPEAASGDIAGEQGLIAADKYTVAQMLSQTTRRHDRRQDNTHRGIGLAVNFIDCFPSDVDEGLFNAILDACCQKIDVQRLEEVMERMRNLEVEPSAVTLGILVKTYGRAGHLDRVLDVWNDMLPQRAQANGVTYGCMLDACVKCHDLGKALEVFEDVKKEGKHRNTVLYTTLIKGCSMQRNLQGALALFREMKEEGVAYNTFTYNSIIDVCINSGAMYVAEGIFQQMIAEEGMCHGASPDLITFSTLLKGYCQAGLLDQAFMVLEAIRERGLPCDELVYNTLIDGCVRIGDLGTGLGFFDSMLRDGARPSPITRSILVKLYRSAGYGQQSPEAVAVLYQHHGLQTPIVVTRRCKRSGRGEKDRGASPHSLLIRSKANDGFADRRPSASSQSSSENSNCQSFSHVKPMSCTNLGMQGTLVQSATSGSNSTMATPCSSASSLPMEVQSMIQNLPEHMRSGPLLISGPYPVPASNGGVAAPPAQPQGSQHKTKAIIKI